jgi:SPP1 gp7 family putative phage head morphogenesis protein
MPSAYTPPSDPRKIPGWLLEREEEIARATVRALSRIIERSLKAFITSLTAAGDMSAFDGIPGEWSAYVRRTLSDRLGGLYLSGGISAWIQAPGTDDLPLETIEGWLQVINNSAVIYSAEATNRLTGPVADSIWNDLRLKVSKAIESGMSTERLADEIRTMGEFSKYRAETIARTEANGAYNIGNYQSAQALGDVGPVEKYWISTSDDRTRPTHVEADGQIRAFADPFIVGGAEMLYPHDPAGPASEIVNCRCVMALLYPGMERPDGTIVPEGISTTTQPSTKLNTPQQQTRGRNLANDLLDDGEVQRLASAKTRSDGTAGIDLSGPNDPMLELIARRQGFDGLPEVVSRETFEARIAEAGHREVFRGIKGDQSTRFISDFKSGEYFGGQGLKGSGTYTSTSRDTALSFADGDETNVIRMALKPNSRVITFREAEDQVDAIVKNADDLTRRIYEDEGRWAASAGYDAIEVQRSGGETWLVVLNRTALLVEA